MRKLLKWLGIGLGAAVGLVLVVAGILYFVGSGRVDRTYTVRTAGLRIPADSAGLARGAHLARTNGCTDCHTADLRGQVMLDIPPFRAVAANLTRGRGGIGARYSDEDWDRTIRHGVKPDGRPVIVMPSAAFHQMSDQDAAALIAYLKSVPPVDNPLPPTEIRAPGRIAAVFQDMTAEVRTGPARAGSTPPVAPTAE
jgi:mono/diheme cytochrome c family protein